MDHAGFDGPVPFDELIGDAFGALDDPALAKQSDNAGHDAGEVSRLCRQSGSHGQVHRAVHAGNGVAVQPTRCHVNPTRVRERVIPQRRAWQIEGGAECGLAAAFAGGFCFRRHR